MREGKKGCRGCFGANKLPKNLAFSHNIQNMAECQGDSCKLPIHSTIPEKSEIKNDSSWSKFFVEGLEDSEGKSVDFSVLNGI